jgi:hypothetical protein
MRPTWRPFLTGEVLVSVLPDGLRPPYIACCSSSRILIVEGADVTGGSALRPWVSLPHVYDFEQHGKPTGKAASQLGSKVTPSSLGGVYEHLPGGG